jgi:hypothetical protein
MFEPHITLLEALQVHLLRDEVHRGEVVAFGALREQNGAVGIQHGGAAGSLERLEGELRPHPQTPVRPWVRDDLNL